MRLDPAGAQIASRFREPRIAIGIIYPTGSIYITNRQGIANLPGNFVEGVLRDISSTSQTLYPDQGRSTIGTLSFTAVDLDAAITDEIRDQLLNQERGIRRREVRVYTGDTDDFNDFVRVETYVIDNVERRGRSYVFTCADRSREQRVNIFVQQKTRLASNLAIADTTVNVLSTEGFEMLAHTASFSDAPSATVGYILIEKTGEIIRYTGKTATSFTGCTRERFGTVAQDIVIEATDDDRKPEVIEFIYLEMPAPQLDYAIKTGKILGTANSLPDSWHMGIDEAHVDASQYQGIGGDLYDPSDVTKGLVLRFTHLKETDGKRFCEEQLHVPMGTFSPISTLGVIGIRRLTSLLSNASPCAILFDANIRSINAVRHEQQRVINRMIIRWNYNGENFTRTDVFFNQTSIGNGETGHGESKPLVLELRGLHVSRHTRATLQRIFDYYTDRYGAPPIELSLKLSRALNNIEIGDVVRVVLGDVPDYTALAHLDRAFEVQSRRMNWLTGDIQVSLFGSTARIPADSESGGGTAAVLADSFYIATGTALSSVLTITGDTVTANGSLTGAADLRNAIYYHPGDLTIAAGVNIDISDNVALFIRGTLTVNGTINGKGRGIAATPDPNTVGFPQQTLPSVNSGGGYLGSTRASGAIRNGVGNASLYYPNIPGTYIGSNAAVPRLNLSVDSSGGLAGLPTNLRGTPGIYGPPTVDSSLLVAANGGAGGAGGAGLLILCRGLLFGAAGVIDLSGADGSPPVGTVSLGGVSLYAGAGGGGAPGALYVVLDGDNVTLPDLTTAFVADHGATPQTGTPGVPKGFGLIEFPSQPGTGIDPGLGALDMFEAAHLIQYVPSNIPVGESDDEIVPAPTALTATADGSGVLLQWTSPPADAHDDVEVWESTTNDRTGAVLLSRRKASSLFVSKATSVTRYYWIRARKERAPPGYSDWHPLSSIAGVEATFGGASGPPGNDGLTALPAAFSPGRVGGAANFVYTLNHDGTTPNLGEIRVQGSKLYHPDGTLRTLSATTTSVTTPFGEGQAGRFWLMWSDSSPATRGFGGSFNSAQVIPVVYEEGEGWRAASNENTRTTFTPLATDCLLAVVEAETTSGGLTRIVPLTGGLEAPRVQIAASAGVQFRQAPNGGAWSGSETDITFTWLLGGVTIATRVVRVTRTGATLTAALQTQSGDPTLHSVIGDGTSVVTIIATHTATGVSSAQSVSVVQSGEGGFGGTINRDPHTSNPSAWETVSGSNWEIATISDGIVGNTELRSIASSLNAWVTEADPPYPIDPTKKYKLHAWVRRKSGNRGVWLAVAFYDAAGNLINSNPTNHPGWDGYGTMHYWGLAADTGAQLPADSVWREFTFTFGESGQGQIPSNAKTFKLAAILNHQPLGTTDGVVAVQDIWCKLVPQDDDVDLADVEWIPVLAGVTRNGQTYIKTGGSNGVWDSSVYSDRGYASCHVSFRFSQTNRGLMVGLNTDPLTDHDHTSLDYAFYGDASGNLFIYQSGSQVQSLGGYTTTEDLAITYDGFHVRFWRNNQVVRTVADAGKQLFLDTSFRDIGGAVNSLVFARGDVGKIDLATKVSGILSAAFAEAGLINQNISINADGTLAGAGGGQVSLPSLPGSVAVGQMTANVIAAIQAVVANLSAIRAELGSCVISTTGHLRSGASAFDGDGGWWLGFTGGEPALSFRSGSQYLRYRPSTGLEINGTINERGSFTGTLTGFTSTVQVTVEYQRVGVMVFLWIDANAWGTSNSTGMSLTGVPAALRPPTSRQAMCVVRDNSLTKIARCSLGSTGDILFDIGDFDGGDFTASGIKGLYAGWMLGYAIDP